MCNSFYKKQQRLKARRRASRKPVRRTILQRIRCEVRIWAKRARRMGALDARSD